MTHIRTEREEKQGRVTHINLQFFHNTSHNQTPIMIITPNWLPIHPHKVACYYTAIRAACQSSFHSTTRRLVGVLLVVNHGNRQKCSISSLFRLCFVAKVCRIGKWWNLRQERKWAGGKLHYIQFINYKTVQQGKSRLFVLTCLMVSRFACRWRMMWNSWFLVIYFQVNINEKCLVFQLRFFNRTNAQNF